MNLLAKFYKVSDINDWNLLEQEMDSQPASRDKYSSCIENQNHVQVQKTVLNPYLETNMAAAKKSQLEGVSLRENWVRQFLFLFLNSGEFLNARTGKPV